MRSLGLLRTARALLVEGLGFLLWVSFFVSHFEDKMLDSEGEIEALLFSLYDFASSLVLSISISFSVMGCFRERFLFSSLGCSLVAFPALLAGYDLVHDDGSVNAHSC